MKIRSPLVTIALALTGVLIIAAALIALGSQERRTFPSANSFLPSGSSAFQELLRRSGYTVVVDQNTRPKLQPGDLAVAFYTNAPTNINITAEQDEDKLAPTIDALTEFVKVGGNMLALPVSPDFEEESKNIYDRHSAITSPSGIPARVSWDHTDPLDDFLDTGDSVDYQAWGSNTQPVEDGKTSTFVDLVTLGKGHEAVVAEGLVATNRFLDRDQNALVLSDTVQMLAKPGARIVFVEAAFGNVQDPGLTEVIGPWAKAAWMQLIFLVIIIVYTLGKPFGLPASERRKERGARELLDAMADTLRRGKMTKLALRAVSVDSNRLLRKWFRTPREMDPRNPETERLTNLKDALNKVDAAVAIGAPEDAAAGMVRDVERLIREVGTKGSRLY
jgi:hypothetical protein